MSRGIAVHVVAGILFVAVGTLEAQEPITRPAVVAASDTLVSTGVLPTKEDSSGAKNDMRESNVLFRLDCVDGIEGDVGVTVAIAPPTHLDDRNDSFASDAPQAKRGTARRWFSSAMGWMFDALVGGIVHTGGR